MPKTLLAIGAHYDDMVFGIPGILTQAARKHYRVVILSLIGDYSNWKPTKGREAEFMKKIVELGREFGAEMRFLKYASHRFEVDAEAKRLTAEVVAEVNPDVSFIMWPHDRHHDHEVASTVAKVALLHGDRVLDGGPFRPARSVFAIDNGPRHTIGFEPNVYVDVTAEWPTAMQWLGRLMALQDNKAYDAAAPSGSIRVKETIAAYRGLACGARYAEAVWSLKPVTTDVL